MRTKGRQPKVVTGILLALSVLLGTNAFAQSASYTYDALDRLTQIVYADGTTVIYTYDAAGNRLTITSCGFVISATSASFAGVGGFGSVDVTTAADCTWTAIANDSFLHVTAGGSGSGSATVTYTAEANNTGSLRTGTLTIAGRTYTVTQSADFAPAITANPSNVTVTSGSNATFTVTASGNPTPTYQWQGSIGAEPFTNLTEGAPYSNVTTATLTVLASAGLNGAQYRAIATNTITPTATSNAATLTVNQAPAITSANDVNFTTGVMGSFTVTTTGVPTGASMVISETGALPSTVTFTDNHNGTATLAGIPAVGAGGTYLLTITADNGVAPSATQNFTLTVQGCDTLSTATIPVGLGSITVDTSPNCEGNYVTGTGISLTANVPSGYVFAGWSGSGGTFSITSTNSTVFTITANASVTATFGMALTLAKTGTGSGTVTSDFGGIDCGSTCSAPIPYGSVVTLTPTASADSVFTGWSGDCIGVGTCQVTMITAKSVAANFNLKGEPTGFYPVTPCRVFDTRDATGSPIIAVGDPRNFTITGKCGIPAGAKAITGNVTVVNGSAIGSLSFIAGNLTSTITTTIQIPISRARANNAVIQLETNGLGTIKVINNTSGTVHLILDVNGYFQ